MMEHTAQSSAALADELRNVVHQAEELLRAIGDDSSEAVEALRERVYSAVDTAKSRLADMEEQAQRASQRAAVATEVYVREHPWTAVAVGVGAGLLLGTLLTRRFRSGALDAESGSQ